MTSLATICQEISKIPLEIMRATVETTGTAANMSRRKVRVYHRAQNAAPAFGLIGVGCISFAESRVSVFERRAGLILDRADTARGLI